MGPALPGTLVPRFCGWGTDRAARCSDASNYREFSCRERWQGILGQTPGPAQEEGRLIHIRLTYVLLVILALALYLPGFWWGAPHATAPDRAHSWGVDAPVPLGPLAEIHNIIQPMPDGNVDLPAAFFTGLLRSQPVLRGLLWASVAVAASMLLRLLASFPDRVRNSRLLRWAFRKLPLGNYLEKVLDIMRGYRHHAGPLPAATGISFLAQTVAIGVALLSAYAMNPAGFAWPMALPIPLGFLANTLPVTPGGLGVGEAALRSTAFSAWPTSKAAPEFCCPGA